MLSNLLSTNKVERKHETGGERGPPTSRETSRERREKEELLRPPSLLRAPVPRGGRLVHIVYVLYYLLVLDLPTSTLSQLPDGCSADLRSPPPPPRACRQRQG